MDKEKSIKKELKENRLDQVEDTQQEFKNDNIDLLQNIERLNQEILAKDDKILRLTAELENTRNRLTREIEQAKFLAMSGFALGVCEIADNMSRARECMKGINSKNSSICNSILQGIDMIVASVDHLFARYGIDKILSVNHKFDPNLHEAMGEEVADNIEVGYIVRELVAGYTINGRLLRPAKVIIAKKLDKQ